MPSALSWVDTWSAGMLAVVFYRLLCHHHSIVSDAMDCHRTKRYKTLSIIAATICVVSFTLILLRWRGPVSVWESLYIFPASFGLGLLNSTQFVGVSAAVEKSQLATTIGIFFLSQQIGMMIGASGSGALLQRTFRNALVKRLGDRDGMSEVSIPYDSLTFFRRILLLPKVHEEGVLIGSFSPPE